jgi:hypothetical protein
MESVERLTPTNWGPDERARNPYKREEILSTVSTMEGKFYMPGLVRRKAPRYQAFFTASNSGLKKVNIDFGSALSKNDLRQVFELADSLADKLEPEYGFVHMIWRGKYKSGVYNSSGVISSEKLQECGLTPPTARTWYGAHIIELIDKKRLGDAGIPFQETKWGGIRFDLVAEPWNSDIEVLSKSQTAVMKSLTPSGVMGNYTVWHRCKPGPKWKPIPEKTSGTCQNGNLLKAGREHDK